jgi:hypothetical protein
MLVLGSACIDVPGSGPPAQWFPLKRELTVQALEGERASFTPALSGDYAVTLNFPWPIEDDSIRNLVNRAASGVGVDKSPARFDFEWRVLDGETLVARGTGRDGATGIVDTGSFGLGGGPLRSRALAFGKFSAEAKRPYTIEWKAGAGLASVIRAKPQLEIMLDPAAPLAPRGRG